MVYHWRAIVLRCLILFWLPNWWECIRMTDDGVVYSFQVGWRCVVFFQAALDDLSFIIKNNGTQARAFRSRSASKRSSNVSVFNLIFRMGKYHLCGGIRCPFSYKLEQVFAEYRINYDFFFLLIHRAEVYRLENDPTMAIVNYSQVTKWTI